MSEYFTIERTFCAPVPEGWTLRGEVVAHTKFHPPVTMRDGDVMRMKMHGTHMDWRIRKSHRKTGPWQCPEAN